MEGPNFLKEKYQLQGSDEVGSTARRTEIREGVPQSKKPAERIQNYLDRFSEILNRDDEGKRERGIEALRTILHEKFIITPDRVPESAFILEQRIARELGHGNVEITDEFKERKISEIIANQKRSLDAWIDYLSSPDAAYPDWAKYWAFRSVTEMGKLVKEEDGDGKEIARYARRTEDSVASFPTLNPRALAMTIGALERHLREKSKPKDDRQPISNQSILLNEEEFQALLSSENFAKIYAQFLIELPEYRAEGLENTQGVWVKYPQGSDPQPLVDSLVGHPLEWCTANYDTAATQLEGGDFHVYYSENESGAPIIPRVAIRMQSDGIAEVRGIAVNQNLDPYIAPVVQEKMKEFPDGAAYERKSEDMKRLTQIEGRMKSGEAPSKEDLRFLYEIDRPINGFGYQKDPRIAELIEGRDIRADIAIAIGCLPGEVSMSKEDALEGGKVFHYGDLDLSNLTSAEGLILPEHVGGSINLSSLTSAEGLTLPEHVGGYLDLSNLTSAEGLILPKRVGGSLFLNSLTSAEGLTLPERVGGHLDLRRLTSAEGLTLPKYVGWDIFLTNLTSADGLTLPEYVGEDLYLSSLTSADGLTLPEHVGGHLDLSNLTSAERDSLRRPRPDLKII